jgi:hypothetical protein
MNLNARVLINQVPMDLTSSSGVHTMTADTDQVTNASLDNKLPTSEESKNQNALMVKISKDKL